MPQPRIPRTQHADPDQHVATSAVTAEDQPVVDRLFERLDGVRAETAARRDQAVRTSPSGPPQARAERDAFAALYQDRLRQLERVENGLVFGRLDRDATSSGTDPDRAAANCDTQYIGRIGLHDEHQEQLLVDWRAPAAQAFYQATAANVDGVRRRRHLKVRDRTVVATHDDLVAAEDSARPGTSAVVGEGALLAAVNEARTGRMRDIVMTLQAEQDEIVRSPLPGVLVVQGAPGTGKTAVALHRAAYLLYTHRERLSSSGMLLIGPTDRFLRYVEDVLPSLGETSVVSATVADLYPGVMPSVTDAPATAVVKGDLRMTRVLHRAVRLRRRMPRAPIPLRVEDSTLTLEPQLVAHAQRVAQRTGEPHNQAREEFCRLVLEDLLVQLATATGEVTDAIGRGELLKMLHAAADVRREVNLCWMPLQPERLLARLWHDREALAEAARGILTAEEQVLLHRAGDRPGWSAEDIPLLDELAELIGDQPDTADTRAARRRQAAEAAEQLRFAQESLTSLGIDEQAVSAELLASRYRTTAGPTELVDRASADRRWTYGHLVVDEAQELSQMSWRMLFRRCPTRSMTVVGDVQQTTSPAGTVTWADVFDLHAAGAWRLTELSVNYRTPGTVMELATRVSKWAAGHPAGGVTGATGRAHCSRSVRSLRAGDPPVAVLVPTVDAGALGRVCADANLRHPQGTTAVIVVDTDRAATPPQQFSYGGAQHATVRDVAVLTATQAKGLEFDTVVVVEPGEFLTAGEQGRRQLYVALTRATQRLILVHSEELPPQFRGLIQPRRLGCGVSGH